MASACASRNCSSRFCLTVSIYWARASLMVMVQCTGEDGVEEGVGAGSSTTMFFIGTSSSSGCLPASRSAAMAAISLWSVVRPSRRVLEHEEAMVGSSGVDRRKGTEADDYGYGWLSSLYSNGGWQRDGRVVQE